MAMKKAELEKQAGLKIVHQKGPDVAGRFGQGSAGTADRREQRRADAAAGLVAFACKLPSELTAKLGERAATFEGGINALVASLLSDALAKESKDGKDAKETKKAKA